MLEWVWKKGGPLVLLMSMWIETASMENDMEIHLKKLGKKQPYDPIIPLLGMFPEETTSEKDTCTPVFYLQ